MSSLIRIPLDEQLGEGQYVEIRNPKLLPWGVQKQLQLALKSENPSPDEQVEFTETMCLQIIRHGNVLDDEDHPIEFPLTPEGLNRLPYPAVEAVVQKFGEVRKKTQNAGELPNE